MALLAVGVALLGALRARLPNLHLYTGHPDEGTYLASAALLAHGYGLFDGVFSSQGPLFLAPLGLAARLFGPDASLLRLAVALSGVLTIGAQARLSTGSLTDVQLIQVTESFQVEYVLLWTDRFDKRAPEYRRWLGEHFELLRRWDSTKRLYVRAPGRTAASPHGCPGRRGLLSRGAAPPPPRRGERRGCAPTP